MSGVIVMTLFWVFAIGIIGFAVWSGIVVGRAKGELIVAQFAEQYRSLGSNKETP